MYGGQLGLVAGAIWSNVFIPNPIDASDEVWHQSIQLFPRYLNALMAMHLERPTASTCSGADPGFLERGPYVERVGFVLLILSHCS